MVPNLAYPFWVTLMCCMGLASLKICERKYVNVNFAGESFWQNKRNNAFVAESVPVLPGEEKE